MMKRALLITIAVALMVFGVAAYAAAVDYPGTPDPISGLYTAEGHVYVNATVNPKVTLTLDQTVMDAGALDPDVEAPQWTGSVNVGTKANVPTTLTASVSGTGAPIFSRAWDASTPVPATVPRGSNAYVDNYSISIDYTTAPGAYQADVLYTLAQ